MKFRKLVIPMEETIHCELVGKREGLYTVYVFRKDTGHLIMCTKLPNWGPMQINLKETGFLTYQFAEAGETYIERKSNTEKTYQYTNFYFKDFVPDKVDEPTVTL